MYSDFHDLPGATTDANRMYKALGDADFEVTLHIARDQKKLDAPIMDLFNDWCTTVAKQDDVFVYCNCLGAAAKRGRYTHGNVPILDTHL